MRDVRNEVVLCTTTACWDLNWTVRKKIGPVEILTTVACSEYYRYV